MKFHVQSKLNVFSNSKRNYHYDLNAVVFENIHVVYGNWLFDVKKRRIKENVNIVKIYRKIATSFISNGQNKNLISMFSYLLCLCYESLHLLFFSFYSREQQASCYYQTCVYQFISNTEMIRYFQLRMLYWKSWKIWYFTKCWLFLIAHMLYLYRRRRICTTKGKYPFTLI